MARRACRELSAHGLPVMGLLGAGLLAAAVPEGASAGAALSAGLFSVVTGFGRGLAEEAAAARHLDPARHAVPAALARLSGTVLSSNDAMRGSGAVPEAGIAALLGGLVDCDAALVYRLSQRARELGFAFERVRERKARQVRFLAVTHAAPDRLLWRVLADDDLADAVPSSLLHHYEAAPFAYLRLKDGAAIASNLRFREIFGADPSAVVASLAGADGVARSGRHMLPLARGGHVAMRALVPASVDRATDIFLFELPQNEMPRVDAVSGLERLPVALMQLTLTGEITWLNAAARRLLGDGAVEGRRLDEVLRGEARPISSLIDEAQGSQRQSRPEIVRLADQTLAASIQLSLTSIGPEQPTALLALLSDASELRQLEEKFTQSQKMEAVGKLAGGVAHDFNNLLTAINGHCDLLLIGKDADQAEYSDLMQIRQNANRAAALVRQLLAFSRKQTLNAELLSVSDVISDTLYLLDRLIGDRVSLALDQAPQADLGLVRADHRQLEQALMNLVVNARDAMSQGGVITISTRRRHLAVNEERGGTLVPAGEYVELAVADEGTGIDEKVIGRVFDPFFTTKPQGEGTGLGLSTAYGIVQQSGGVILAENRPEGGACFRILLPRIEAAPAPVDIAPAAGTRPANVDLTGRGRILLVEDEAAVRSFTARALTIRGYDVVIAEEGEDALEVIRDAEETLDLVISDVVMPGIDGPALIARAREIRPDLKVLFVSGYAEEAVRKSIESADFEFLPKPFSLGELTATVKRILGDPGARRD